MNFSGILRCVREKRLPFRYQRIWRFGKYCSLSFPLQSLKLLAAILQGNASRCRGLILHMYGPSVLRDTLEACRSLGMKPFLVWGTLLGYYREGRFIAHDKDIDLGLLSEGFTNKARLIRLMKQKGYLVRKEDDYVVSFYRAGFRELHIDLQHFYLKNGQIVFSIAPRQLPGLYSYYFPTEIFSQFRTVPFIDGVDVNIPTQTEAFLTIAYGNWRIPQKKWHYLHSPRNLMREEG